MFVNIFVFSSCEYSFFTIFTGVPVHTIFLAFGILERASSNDIKTVSALGANIFTAFPGNALLSCNMTGIFSLFAAHTTGPQIYPPAPTIISGLNSFIIFFALPVAINVAHIFLKLAIDICLLSPYASIVFNPYPALGTKSFSKPLVVPIKIISEFGSSCFILFAIANPGFICPAVPAAATITLIFSS